MTLVGRAMAAVVLVFWAVPLVVAALAWFVLPQDEVEGCTSVAVFDCMSVRDTLRLASLVLGPFAIVAGAVLLVLLAAVQARMRRRAARPATRPAAQHDRESQDPPAETDNTPS